MARRGYPAEFRRRALDLVAAGKTVAEVARLFQVIAPVDLDVAATGADRPGRTAGLSSGARKELRAARLRIRALESELPCTVVRLSC